MRSSYRCADPLHSSDSWFPSRSPQNRLEEACRNSYSAPPVENPSFWAARGPSRDVLERAGRRSRLSPSSLMYPRCRYFRLMTFAPAELLETSRHSHLQKDEMKPTGCYRLNGMDPQPRSAHAALMPARFIASCPESILRMMPRLSIKKLVPVRESFFRQNAVKPAHFAIGPVGQKPVLSPQFFGELLLTGAGIDADGQDLRVVFGKVFDIILIPCQLGPSAAGKGEGVKRHHHVLTSTKLAQLVPSRRAGPSVRSPEPRRQPRANSRPTPKRLHQPWTQCRERRTIIESEWTTGAGSWKT